MIKDDFLKVVDKASTLLYQNHEDEGLSAYREFLYYIQNSNESGLSRYFTNDSIKFIKNSAEASAYTDIIGLADAIVMTGATLSE